MRLFRRRGESGSSLDLLVVGLGNPGREYARNRHNVGWMVVDELARRHGGGWRSKFSAQLADVRIDGHRVALLKPETYMNESGRAVKAAAQRVVPLALDVIGVVLIWRVGRRTIGERPALVAAALCWIWPPELMLLSMKEIGFYASNTFYCALVLLLVLRAYERPDAVRVGALGLVLGLAAWETTQIVPL